MNLTQYPKNIAMLVNLLDNAIHKAESDNNWQETPYSLKLKEIIKQINDMTLFNPKFKPLGSMTNTETLLFVLGYQGGTIHALARELDVSTDYILNADNERMGDLCRLAQNIKRKNPHVS